MRTFGIVGGVCAVAAALWWTVGRAAPPLAEGDGGTAPRLERVQRIQLGEEITATGVIRPKVGARVAVGSRVSGVLRRLHVTVGDPVAKGALLAELDPTELEAELESAEADLESALVERDFARRQLDRARDLLDGQVISRTEFETAERASRAGEARVRAATARRRSAEIRLGYTRIRAPISGIVASVSTQVGETVAASLAAPTFVTIIDLDRLEVWAYVDETDIGRVEPGLSGSFTVDTYPSAIFPAAVTAIRPQAEIQNNVVNYITLLDIGDPGDHTLRPEMTTTVTIRLDPAEASLAVPSAALRVEEGTPHVLVPGPDGPRRRRVSVGRRGRTHVEITGGLSEGDTVLVGASTGPGSRR